MCSNLLLRNHHFVIIGYSSFWVMNLLSTQPVLKRDFNKGFLRKIFKNGYFKEHLRTAASVLNNGFFRKTSFLKRDFSEQLI